MGRIVAIGANVYDTIVSLSQFPDEDTKMKSGGFTHAGGGPAATGLVAAAKLGADCAFIGNCADDDGGRFLTEDFKRYGVDTSFIRTYGSCRSFMSQIWLSSLSASRTCVFDKGTLPPLILDYEQLHAVRSADILMVDGNELEAAITAAKLAKEHGVTVLYVAGGLYEGVERLLPLTDILIPSKEFALKTTEKDTPEDAAKTLYEKYSPKVVVITCGSAGGVMYDGNKVQSYPAYPSNAVDTNGAGDVFHGAFAAALTFGYDLLTCCHFASATSAIKCEKIGAREAVPDFDTVINKLNENGFTV